MSKIVKQINSWAQGIVIAVVIGAIIELIIPNGKNKKYIKTVIGIYIIFVIMYPIINKLTGKSLNLNNLILKTETTNTIYNLNMNEYINNNYKETIKQEIEIYLNSKGYKLNSINIEIEDNQEYGKINQIILNIKEENKTLVNEINTVVIGNTSTKNKQNNLNEEQTNEIKAYIAEKYSINLQQIIIN